MAALERAVALTQVDRIAFAIAEHLKFDVARIAEILFNIDRRIAESGFRFAARLLHQRFDGVFAFADLHAPATAARRCLDDHRIANFLGDLLGFIIVGNRAIAAHKLIAFNPSVSLFIFAA